MLALLFSKLNAVLSQARTHLNDNQGQLALQQEEETLADPVRCMPGLEGSTNPQSPHCERSNYQPRAIVHRQGQNMWPEREEDLGGGHCKLKGKVFCLEEFSQGISLFKPPPGFSEATLLSSTALLSSRDLCRFNLYPAEHYLCSVATRH